MGASQSSRRVSFENEDDPSSIIKITDSVVERLRAVGAQQLEEPPEQVRKLDITGPPSDIAQSNAGQFQYYPPPYFTSHQIQQEIEKELQKNNEYWQLRLGSLMETQDKLNQVMETEYAKTLEEMEKSLPRLPPKDGKLPCQDKKAVVVKCYKLNAKQPLLCSNEVQAFTSCMTNMRIKLQEEGKLG